MKKENRKMAQERRARERAKKARQKRIKKILKIGLPLLAILILAAFILWDTLHSKSEDTSSSTQQSESQQTEESSEEQSETYQTDSSLTVEDGDTVNIDYVGTIDGVEFEGGSTDGNGTDLVIGSGNYIDDFEEQLIGAHPGDTVEVQVTFPEDYGNEDLNGKDAVFTVTINGIYE